MDRNITPIDTRHEAIKAMANALHDIGFAGDSDPTSITVADVRYATGRMISRLVDLKDEGFLFEFLTEPGGWGTDASMFGTIADYMVRGNPDYQQLIADTIATRARWYGESFIPEALDMLDSASEIARDRQVDEQIKQAKETA